MSRREIGDWDCPNCQRKGNFGTKSVCRCGYSKNTKSVNTDFVNRESNDWVCSCGVNNFARRVQCFKCNKSKYGF